VPQFPRGHFVGLLATNGLDACEFLLARAVSTPMTRAQWLCAALLAAASACAITPAEAAGDSVGYVGCTDKDITITDLVTTSPSDATWVATCNGHAFRCASVANGKGTDISCAPKLD
jgi:hypothetical protein